MFTLAGLIITLLMFFFVGTFVTAVVAWVLALAVRVVTRVAALFR